jgi:hypothetical protein
VFPPDTTGSEGIRREKNNAITDIRARIARAALRPSSRAVSFSSTIAWDTVGSTPA